MRDRLSRLFLPFLVTGGLIIFAFFLSSATISSYAEEETIGIDAAHFPDGNFRSYISKALDADKDGSLSRAEREAVKEIDVRLMAISSLSGLEYFPSLVGLNCGENAIKKLDVSGNPELERLFCRENQLVSLNVTRNGKLTMLDCYSNQLKELNVKNNPYLVHFSCGYNQLEELELEGNAGLTYLECAENGLKTLDIGRNTSLEILECYGNQLKELDVSGAKNMYRLYCFSNSLTKLNISGNPYLLRAVQKGKRSLFEKILSYSYEDADGSGGNDLWLDVDVKLIRVAAGWHVTDGNRYYYNDNGEKVTLWKSIDGKKYYFGKNGVMRTGWKKIDGKKYYFGKNGVMRTGWKKIDGKKYYFGKNGVMRTGWKKIDGKYYYFKTGGAMTVSQFVDGYWLKADGTRKKMARSSWRVDEGGRWYGNTEGWFAKSRTLIIDGKKYKFNSKGYKK